MSEIRASTRNYLAMLAVVAAGVSAIALTQTSTPSLRDSALVVAFIILQAAAVFFPLALGPQQKLQLNTAVIFAAVLLFDPGTAVLVASVGSFAGQALHRHPVEQVLFNTCQPALQAGLAGLLLTVGNQPDNIVAFDNGTAFLGLLGAAAVMYAVDVITVGIIVRLEAGRPLLTVFQEMPSGSLLDDISQFALGLLTAISVDAHLWTLPVVVLLAFQMYAAVRRNIAAQQHEHRMRTESERTADARREFLLTASHELKTPITSVKMAAQLLDRALIQRNPAFQVDEERLIRWRDQLLLGIERLESLVSDLLDAARIQQGRLEIHPEYCDLAALAREVVERFEFSAERTRLHELVLDAPEPVEGYWDPSAIDQVLTNFISNALKYSPDGGIVTVRAKNVGDSGVVSVSDEGIGISDDSQAEIFKPFARVEKAQHGISGTGLGLYITKRVIEQHGGTIEFDSIPGIGTTMTAKLPRFASGQPEPNLIDSDMSVTTAN